MQSLTNQKFLRDILHKFGFFTKKNLWQNFLIDQFVLDDIIKVAEISKGDEVIEIWPWPWVLTQELIKTWAKITALEIDDSVIPVLQYVTEESKNLEIKKISALEFKPEKSWFILCANIPYYLTSPILRHYLWGDNKPKRAVLLLQKEVAQKICAKESDLSILSLQVLIYWIPKIVRYVSKWCFFPAPKVDSAVLCIDIYDKPLVSNENIYLFWDIVHACFTEKRKKIINTLSKYRNMWQNNALELLSEAWIDKDRRPQTLSIAEWVKLTEGIKKI